MRIVVRGEVLWWKGIEMGVPRMPDLIREQPLRLTINGLGRGFFLNLYKLLHDLTLPFAFHIIYRCMLLKNFNVERWTLTDPGFFTSSDP